MNYALKQLRFFIAESLLYAALFIVPKNTVEERAMARALGQYADAISERL